MELNYFQVKPEGVGLWFRVGEEEGRCQVGVLAYLIGHRTILSVPIGKAFCWSQLCFFVAGIVEHSNSNVKNIT